MNTTDNTKAFPSKELDYNQTILQGKTIYYDQDRGMELRDYFAAKENGKDITENYTISRAEEVLNRKIPSNNIELAKFWFELEARLQYMKADAMMKQRKL